MAKRASPCLNAYQTIWIKIAFDPEILEDLEMNILDRENDDEISELLEDVIKNQKKIQVLLIMQLFLMPTST